MAELDNIEAAPAKAAVPRKRSASKSKKRIRRPAVKIATPVTVSDAEVNEEFVPVKHNVTTPWKPASILNIPESYKNPKYTYRWCNTKKIGNIEKKIQEGWVIDKDLSKRLKELYGGLPKTVNDGSDIDGTVRMREMIVMKMPKEMAISRNKYYSDKANQAFTSSKQQLMNNMMADSGDSRVKTFGSVIESKDGEIFRR